MEYDWYIDFYGTRVLPKAGRDMGECEGFFAWMGEHDPELYAKITAADDLVNSLWLSRGDKAAFKEACKDWYRLLMEAKREFEGRKG